MQVFKKGDRVRVRSWDDMKKEFGEEFYEDDNEQFINTPNGFNYDMIGLCGMTGTVIGTITAEKWMFSIQTLKIKWDTEPAQNLAEGRNFDNGMFELVERPSLASDRPVLKNPKIVITTNGVATMAEQYDGDTLVHTVTAVCPDDGKYDFNVGAVEVINMLTAETLYRSAIQAEDIVKVIYDEAAYTTNLDWIREHAPDWLPYYAYGHKPNTDSTYTVIMKGIIMSGYPASGEVVYLIAASGGKEVKDTCYLVREYGIRKYY